MRLVAGVDSSTQSCKLVVCEAESGEVLRTASVAHPAGSEVDPADWWKALESASSGLLDDVEALAVAGQQHGMVTLDGNGEVVRKALLWNDTRSAGSAADLVRELGGPEAWATEVGSVPVASFTVTKLRWMAEHEPDLAHRTERVLLPHDWLTWRLGGGREAVTDRGDASGTGYWSPISGQYRPDLAKLAFGREVGVPRVAAVDEVVGETSDGIRLAPGTGDNMAAALGLDLQPGDVLVSLGTSGTVFAVSDQPTVDGTGTIAGFADATGRFLPLVCTLNAARVLDATAALLGVDMARLGQLAMSAPSGAGGLTLLPYLDGERTPNLPDATGSLVGMTRDTMTPAHLARAAVEGMLCGLADGLDALRASGVEVRRVLLIGGAAKSVAVRAIAPAIFGAEVLVPRTAEYVALGAARQAAWALEGSLPSWPRGDAAVAPTPFQNGAAVRTAYAEARSLLHPG